MQPRSDYRRILWMARNKGWSNVAPVDAFSIVAEATQEIDSALHSESGKPIVQLVETQFAQILNQLEKIIKPDVYTQGDHLVRPNQSVSEGEIKRSADQLSLIPVTQGWAKKRFSEICTFERWAPVKQTNYPVGPSGEHINSLLDLGSWDQLNAIEAISRAPYMRTTGEICDQPGYNGISRVLYVPSAEFPRIPSSPTRDDAGRALNRIRDVFDQFPWKEQAFEAAFLAHVLSEVGRLAVDKCPMFFYSAPDAATGKTLLQQMAARIAHGNSPSLRPWVTNPEEIRKTIYSSLLAGDRSLQFDNVPSGTKVRSAELCAALTSPNWQDRKLGESEAKSVPNHAVFSASGNNITAVGDLARRSLVIRMDANTERLAEREFKIPELEPYVDANRPQLLTDALTIIKAYHLTKGLTDVKMPIRLPSFERWSKLIREPLIWLGLPDPVITQKETDNESASVGEIYARLEAAFGDREFMSIDVVRLVGGISDPNGELASELVANGCQEPNNPTKVGYFLRACRDRISGGIKLVSSGTSQHRIKWKFERVRELT
jgi:hypothetical protein